MPGAGKTSTLTRILEEQHYNYCLLPELSPNPLLLRSHFNNISRDYWSWYHVAWKDRIKILSQYKLQWQQRICMLFDRSYYTNLAFTYATGNLAEYQAQLAQIQNDFKQNDFDAIIILDASPTIGIQRRINNKDVPPYPWSNINFLEKLREFYHVQLPKIYSGTLYYISTDNLTIAECQQQLHLHLPGKITEHANIPTPNTIANLIYKQAMKYNLGRPYTKIVNVLGSPTVYFRQHALQLNHKEQVVFLDNLRLQHLLCPEKI